MAIAITLKSFLEEHEAHYEVIAHPRTTSTLQTCEVAHVPGDQMVKTVLLGDDDSYVMALLPASHKLDLERVNNLLGRRLYMISEDEISSAFADCEIGALPPIGDAYGIETIVDLRLMDQPHLYFESGDHSLLLGMEGGEFVGLLKDVAHKDISQHL